MRKFCVAMTLTLAAGRALAIDRIQPGEPAMGQPPGLAVDASDITGRDLAGIRLPSAVTAGELTFAASRAAVWAEPGAGEHPVQRMLLSGDALVRIGTYEFSAAQAAVWLQRLPETGPGGEPVYQVFAYFDRVGTPTADPAFAFAGDRLSVQGVIAASAPVSLRADVTRPGPPVGEPFVAEAERKLATYLRRLVLGDEAVDDEEGAAPRRRLTGPIEPGVSRPLEPAVDEEFVARVREVEERFPPAPRSEPIFARTGVFAVSAESLELVSGEEENALIVTGPLVVQYWDRRRDRTLQLTAERAVVFLEPGPLAEMTSFEAERVRGIYLEGDVVADGEGDTGHYTVRAPKVYYDVRNDKALMLDAVFWTYDELRRLPLYVRAEAIRQESANQYKAESATLSNTPFFEPHLSIGASSVTIARVPRSDPAEGSRTVVDARNITLRAGGVPFFYWPIYRGDPERMPLRAFGIENSSGFGFGVRTAWDVWTLLGKDPPRGLGTDLLLEYYTQRGFVGGVDTVWTGETYDGGLLVYGAPDDRGEDRLAGGRRLERDGEFRGMILGEHRADLDERWSVYAEGSYISDENFVDAYFDSLARNRREFTNSATVQRTEGNTAFRAQAKGALNDFTPNEYILQTPGFTVDRLPEVSYFRLADDLFDETAPGLVTYFSEYRLGRLGLNFTEPTAHELGYESETRARDALGVGLHDSIAERLEAQGLDESPVLRFDTRHELSMPLQYGPLNVTPFASGRATVYDEEFDEYSEDADEAYRLHGGVGTTFSTEIQKVDNGVESRLLDLHRIRHIVEPSLTLWYGGTTIDGVDLPAYDPNVETLSDGATARVALDQTWQTQRGGPGRWRSVDVFRLDVEYVSSTDEAEQVSPIGRFFDYRPELSNLGDYATVEGSWLVTDVLALSGATVYDFNTSQPARTSAGVLLQHRPDFSTFAEVRYINSQDATYLSFGADYELTRKYALTAWGSYDMDRGDFQNFSAEVRRRLPSVILGLHGSYNNITSDSSIGVTILPVGVDRSAARLERIGTPTAGRRGTTMGR